MSGSETREFATIGATKYVIALIISKWTFMVSYNLTTMPYKSLLSKCIQHSSGCDYNFEISCAVMLLGLNILWPNWKENQKLKWVDTKRVERKFQEIWSVRAELRRRMEAYGKGIKFSFLSCHDWMQWNQFLLQIYRHRKNTHRRSVKTAHGTNI